MAIWSVFYIVACLKQAVVPVRDWPGMVTEVGSFLVQAGPRGSVRKSLQKKGKNTIKIISELKHNMNCYKIINILIIIIMQ